MTQDRHLESQSSLPSFEANKKPRTPILKANPLQVRMLDTITELYPICRSITGPGLRRTLDILARDVPLEITRVPSGSTVFDWTVPPEWQVDAARVIDDQGRCWIDFAEHNLHLINYSQPFRGRLSWQELAPHVHSLPNQPTAIPYRTSYYQPQWGFCAAHETAQQMRAAAESGRSFDVDINTQLHPSGELCFGEVFLPGSSSREVVFSSHVCHPSLANDNLAAVAIAKELIAHIASRPRCYSYRFLFAPGTIGAIAWLAHRQHQLHHIEHGLVLALLGDQQASTYKRSRSGNVRIDRIAEHVLRSANTGCRILPYSPTGYDERQFGSPGFDLPIGRLTRSTEGEYPEYHTSLDDLTLISAAHLVDSYEKLCAIVDCLEEDRVYRATVARAEPQLGKRGLYDSNSGLARDPNLRSAALWMLNQADGRHGLREISSASGLAISDLESATTELLKNGLLQEMTPKADAFHQHCLRLDCPAACEPDLCRDNRNPRMSALTAEEAHERSRQAHRVIPGGTHTYAKGDDQFPINAPRFIADGQGCHVTDCEGRTFIEYGMGLRSVGLGHAYSRVVQAACHQMHLGSNFTRPATIELDAANDLLSLLPAAEMVKFTKNGSDATTAAIRLARAYTGREKVAICTDHPFFSVDDWFIAQTPMAAGIPTDVARQNIGFKYNDLEHLEDVIQQHSGQLACLIMEAANYTEPAEGYLRGVQELCRREGIVFILDEMITGFRWHNGGAQAAYGLQPDLSTFGKAMGNGFSVAALTGRRELMQLGGLEHDRPRVFLLSYTHGAETHCLAAARATMQVYREQPVVESMYRQGEKLRVGLEKIAIEMGIEENFYIVGRDCNLIYITENRDGVRSQAMRTLLLQELIERGVLAPSLVVSYSHSDDVIARTLEAFESALSVYKLALDNGAERYLRGRASKPVFRKYN